MIKLRFATLEDTDWLIEMLYAFHQESPYSSMPLKEDYVRPYLEGIISADNNVTILLVAELEAYRVGFLAAIKTPFHITGEPIAAELAWWVDQPYRGTGAAAALKSALEEWAKVVGCRSIQMCTMTNKYHDVLNRYYKQSGYKHCETSFLKEI